MNLGINLIELSLMTLIGLSQSEHHFCDNLFYISLVIWIDAIKPDFYYVIEFPKTLFCFCIFVFVFSHSFTLPTNYSLKFPLLFISELK